MNFLVASLFAIASLHPADEPIWPMHVIDASSQGADGVRLGDINGDGLADIVTGWEQGGVVRVYVNPGPEKSKSNWPRITVGEAPNVEDAVFVDLDGDGVLDVVSSCEGETKQHFVHWAPGNKELLDESKWKTESIPATANLTRWMFCLPMNVDRKNGIDLIVGSKDPQGQIGWLESPENARDLAAWKYHQMQTAGWIMSLRKFDFDQDGDDDLLASDRKGELRGVYWLENDPHQPPSGWKRNAISGNDQEFMFLDVWRDNKTKQSHVVTATRNGHLLLYSAEPNSNHWTLVEIPNPNQVPNGKAVAAGDINLDGRMDLVHTTNTGETKLPGVAVLFAGTHGDWIPRTISSNQGIKYDRMELLDLDGDGDLDVLTCEERANLGVIWFENPAK